MWQIASARASAASAGLGASVSRSSRVTIAPTCALSARPLPVTAALTSLGVCSATGIPRRAATSSAMPLACAVPITVLTLCWLKTRSTATASGCTSPRSTAPDRSRSGRAAARSAASAPVRTTPTSTSESGLPMLPSTTPTPQRVRPGSMPSTRMGHSSIVRTPVRTTLARAAARVATTRRPPPRRRGARVRPQAPATGQSVCAPSCERLSTGHLRRTRSAQVPGQAYLARRRGHKCPLGVLGANATARSAYQGRQNCPLGV